ncbi:AcrR family transcriptional regulator [Bradyrhizobium sp. AZCC 2262]|uniref:TetR/AcrR family transcriptional regulator C-terminal domain-containing protein n=1 Tax=Bradyrhizobium sp. AZCC 2262 TaxID=3117022 RepID=UPI002FF1DB86
MKRSDPAAKLSQEDSAREEEILQAAFDVFTEKGFHGARMLDVASRARASKTTLYARYPSKEALFEALMAWSTRQGTDALDAIAADETLDPLTALQRFAAQLLALMLQPKKLALFRIAVAEGDRLSAVGRTYSAFTRDHGMECVRAIVARLLKQKLIEIDDRAEFGHSFIGLLQGELFTRALLGTIPSPHREEIDRHARRAVTRLMRAYAASDPHRA